ncbi:YdcF family protein [Bacillus carboniphilus]|uniref:YdcF family protein n=1 Tax=Bacillus carboniphilus TaxID=86663 RepID=A0ABY9JU61_9BACI|nr:YdcF family protein [Bacillus carboniphilus]WLR42278.1 YdcF family protein [Bacillus carboniphilus]
MSHLFDRITEFIFVETTVLPADVILIPGSNHPPLMEKAASLYNQGLAPYILPSGGYKDHVGMKEYEYLRRLGLENGVPQEAILKENQPQHTLENATLSLRVLNKENINSKKVIIVCKAAHSCRALLSYQSVFPKEAKFFVSPVVDRYGITKENWAQSERGIKRIMTEVKKVETYFGQQVPNLINIYEEKNNEHTKFS